VRFSRAIVGIVAGLAGGAGCDAILGIDDGIPRDGGGPGEAGDAGAPDVSDAGVDAIDAAAPMCDPDAAFAAPKAFSTLNTTGNDVHMRLVPSSELVAYFQSVRDGGFGAADIYTATRPSIGDTWTGIADVVGVNTSTADTDPTVSADQLTLYYTHASDIYRATRSTITAGFGAPVALGAINSTLSEFAPYLVDDGSSLYFSSTRDSDAGVASLFVTQPLGDGGFTPVVLVDGSGLGNGDNRFAAVTADQLVMYFASNRSAGQGGFDIWTATRTSTSMPFGAPRAVPEVSSASNEWPDWISSDRCRLYFSSNRGAGDDLYVATKTPP
jgi:hypothetical protein